MNVPPIAFEDRSAYKARMNSLLEIDPARTVVLTVDMQRQYLDRDLPGGSPVPAADAEHVLTHSKRVLDFARSRGVPVIHAYVQRRPIESQRGLDVSQAKRLKEAQQGLLPSDRMAGSPQGEVPAILIEPEDVHVTTKKSMDCFLDTELDLLLRRVFNADTVILMGVNTDTCVFSTAFSTSNRGYKPIVVSDCVASNRGQDQHWMALELMARSFVWVLTAEELMDRVEAGLCASLA
jgi:biuret amidohydrolase